MAAPEKFSLAIPAFHQEVSKALGDTDPSVWRALPALPHRGQRSPYLADAFVQESYEFYGKTPMAEGTEAALEARAGHHRERRRRSLRPVV
ncbi:hypothetical protein QT383_19870 [Stenotrophomonas rhizophila]